MPPAPHGSDYPAYQQPLIPPAPRVPEEMRAPAFVMGVQPIRTATPDAWGTPRAQHGQHGEPGHGYLPSPMQAIHGSMPAGYAGNAAANQIMPGMVAASPRGMNQTPYPRQPYYQQQQQGYHPQGQYPVQPNPTPMPGSMSMVDRVDRAQPVGSQLTQPPPPSAKVGRFAWFVAGAAFGITFAFFATGFFNSGKAATQDFPSAPALTVYNSEGTVIASGRGWDASLTDTFTLVGAFALPIGSADAALLVTLTDGNYSISISGEGSGVVLAEIYELPVTRDRLGNAG